MIDIDKPKNTVNRTSDPNEMKRLLAIMHDNINKNKTKKKSDDTYTPKRTLSEIYWCVIKYYEVLVEKFLGAFIGLGIVSLLFSGLTVVDTRASTFTWVWLGIGAVLEFLPMLALLTIIVFWILLAPQFIYNKIIRVIIDEFKHHVLK